MLARASASLSVLSGYTILRIVVSHISIGLVSPPLHPNTRKERACRGPRFWGSRSLLQRTHRCAVGLDSFAPWRWGIAENEIQSKI